MSYYVTRGGRRTKKVNYSDTKHRFRRKKEQRSKSSNPQTIAKPARYNETEPNQVALMINALRPPSDVQECDYMISLWKSLHTFSKQMVQTNNKYKRSFNRKRKSSKKVKKPKISTEKAVKIGIVTKERIYAIKRPSPAFILYNASTSKGAKISAKSWHSLSEKQKQKWVKKAKNERAKYDKIKKQWLRSNKNWSVVPEKWKRIDRKAEKKRKKLQKMGNESEESESVSGSDSSNDSNGDGSSESYSAQETDDSEIESNTRKKRKKKNERKARKHTKRMPVLCEYCPRTFDSIQSTIIHMENEHNYVHY